MDVSATNNQLNSSLQGVVKSDAPQKPLNAFGIGQANKPEVELSAQGKILQQVEQARQQSSSQTSPKEEVQTSDAANNYVRVSSSVGSAQRNNLSGDEATELYRSIEKLL